MGRALRWILGAVAVLVVLAVVAGVVLWLRARPPEPDAFYDPPSERPARPGALLRHEPFTRKVPAGARAWRILYTTTRGDGRAAVASALVVASTSAPAGPRPVLAWAHGTTGVARGCAPSLLPEPFAAIPAWAEAVAAGWVVVATDYTGLGTDGPHGYLVSQDEGRAVLDSIRAVREFDPVDVGDDTVVWGHSQGGHAALAAGALAPTYATDVDLAGVAAISPATDLAALLARQQDTVVGKILTAYTITSWGRTQPGVDRDALVRGPASGIVADLAGRCLTAPEALVSVAGASVLRGRVLVDGATDQPGLAAALVANTPDPALTMPLFVGQGAKDELVVAPVTDAFVARACAAGTVTEAHSFPADDHLSIVAPGAPVVAPLMTWTTDRLAGRPAPSTC